MGKTFKDRHLPRRRLGFGMLDKPDNLRDLNARNPYLHGPYGPVAKEITVTQLEVIGEIPSDLHGAYYRTGPNPEKMPTGMHHWFDGHGMVHAIYFEDGRAEYRNRYIGTSALSQERAGTLKQGDIFYPATQGVGTTVYKDTANTDIVCHNGQMMALWYIGGQPVRLDPRTLETVKTETFNGKLPKNVSAHSKVDLQTGEFVFFDYELYAPFYTFGTVSADNELTHVTQVELPGPRLPHDMAITENYAVLMDLPIVFTDQGLKNKLWQIHHDPKLMTRFGVIPRGGDGRETKWFDFPPCYIYHVVNAWEDGEEVVMLACKMVDNGLALDPQYGAYASMVNVLTLRAHLYEWRMNMKTGQTRERQMDDTLGEFPVVNLGFTGRKTQYSYHGAIADVPLQAFDGILKYDLSSGQAKRHPFDAHVFGSEPAFAPRLGAVGEDDGYVISFTQNIATGQSEALILDAQNITDAPLARVQIPQRVPLGFHATWANASEMKSS